MGEISWKELNIINGLFNELKRNGKLKNALSGLGSSVQSASEAIILLARRCDELDVPLPENLLSSMNDLAAKQALQAEAPAPSPAASGGSLRDYLYALENRLYGAIEGETERWDEGREKIRKTLLAIKAGGKGSIERTFCEENAACSKSTWHEKMGALKAGEKAPDIQMMMRCCIGLHRTENEAFALMAMAGYNIDHPTSKADEELIGRMNEVLRQERYCAKHRNNEIFGGKREISDDIRDIGEMISTGLRRAAWKETESKALRTQYRMDVETALCDHFAGRAPEGVDREGIGRLLESLKNGMVGIEGSDTEAVLENAAYMQKQEQAKETLRELLYVCGALSFTRSETAGMIKQLGYFRTRNAVLPACTGRDGIRTADRSFAKAVMKNCSVFALPERSTSQQLQEKIYKRLYERISAYWLWASQEETANIEASLNALEEKHFDAQTGLFCRTYGVNRGELEMVFKGRRMPDRKLMDAVCRQDDKTGNAREKENSVLNDKETKAARQRWMAAEEKHRARLSALLKACVLLEMTREETGNLLKKVGYPVKAQWMTKDRADEGFSDEVKHVCAIAQEEPSDADVTEAFNALYARAVKKSMTEQAGKELKKVVGAFYVKSGDKALFEALMTALNENKLGGIPAGKTLALVLEKAYMEDAAMAEALGLTDGAGAPVQEERI